MHRAWNRLWLPLCFLFPGSALAAPEIGSEQWQFDMSKAIAVELAQTSAWSLASPYLSELSPKTQDWNLLLLQTKVELQRGNIAKADEIVKRALAEHPTNPRILAMAGNVSSDAGRYEEAAQYLEKARGLQPRNATILLSLARVRFVKQEWEQVISLYETALGLVTPTSEMYVRLATAYENTRQLERTEYYLKANLSIHPNRVLALMPLERFYRRNGMDDQANAIQSEREKLEKKENTTRQLRPLLKSIK